MSNPTTKVANFSNSLDGFAGVDPIRYSNGLWLEQAATNLVANPAGVTIAGWAIDTDLQITAVTLAVPINGVTTGFRVTATADKNGGFVARSILQAWASAGPYAFSGAFYLPAAAGLTSAVLQGANYSGASDVVQQPIDTGIRDSWQEIRNATLVVSSGDTGGHWRLMFTGTLLSGQWFEFTCAQAESGTFSTSPVSGAFGDGYGWTGTAHNSQSTRAASSASVATANHLDASSGSLAFRVTPQIETSVEEIWGEAGTKGAATDHLRWGRDATKHPYVEWSSNNAAYQRLTATETHDAGTEKFLYLGWSGVQTWLQVDDTAINVGTRAAPTGSLGAGNLILEAL